MHRLTHSEVDVPTDLLASLLMEQARASSVTTRELRRLAAKVYGVMAVTTLTTFATLVTGYQYLFRHQLFA
jgi:hypothetical protein